MTVPDDVREALADKVWAAVPLEWHHRYARTAVDTVLAHLEQVGWVAEPDRVLRRPEVSPLLPGQPVYRIRKDTP